MVVPPSDLLAGPLSAAMRQGSRREHEAAEGSRFMAALLAGRLAAPAYAAYLARLRAVYGALESVGRAHAEDPAVAAVLDPALERGAALEEDLAFWSDGAPAPGACAVTCPATAAYVARVRQAAAWGGRYAAHHYTRYLGDLSGGQAVGRVLTREFALTGGRGVRFYDFPGIPRPTPYKIAYRARLDALAMTTRDKAAVVAEVRVAFALNQALLEALDPLVDAHARVPRS